MSNWWAAELWELHPVLLVAWVVWVVFSITLHELGHGWAALRAGDRTPAESGHMTWNPLVHMGSASLVVFALIGLAWGAMPVEPRRFRGRYDEAIVAAAGPAMNFGLAVLCHALLAAWLAAAGGHWAAWMEAPDDLFRNVAMFLRVGAVLNLVLIGLNLLPIPPLDGSRILGSLVPGVARAWESDGARVAAMVLLVGVLFFGSDALLGWAFAVSERVQDAIMPLLIREEA